MILRIIKISSPLRKIKRTNLVPREPEHQWCLSAGTQGSSNRSAFEHERQAQSHRLPASIKESGSSFPVEGDQMLNCIGWHMWRIYKQNKGG